jgi:hypothetical protein
LLDFSTGEFLGWVAQDAGTLVYVAPDLQVTPLASVNDFVHPLGSARSGHMFLNLDGNLQVFDVLGTGSLLDTGYDFPTDPRIGQPVTTTAQPDGERLFFVAATGGSPSGLLVADVSGAVQVLHEPTDATEPLSNSGPMFTFSRIIYAYSNRGTFTANKIVSLSKDGSDVVVLADTNDTVVLGGSGGAVFHGEKVLFQTVDGISPSTLFVRSDDGSEASTIIEDSDLVGRHPRISGEAVSAFGVGTAEAALMLEGVGDTNSAGGAAFVRLSPNDPGTRVSFGQVPDEFVNFSPETTANRYKLAQGQRKTLDDFDLFFYDVSTPDSLLRLTDTPDRSEFLIQTH